MRAPPIEAGAKFGRLTVVSLAYIRNANKHWNCLCACGGEAIVTTGRLNSGNTRSCGCLKAEVRIINGKSNATHGYRVRSLPKVNKIYRAWSAMRNRCNNPNNPAFKNYGGRGIHVCSRWDSFENFLADMGECEDGLSIDRIDNNKDYEPENCRWATTADQNRNKRGVKLSGFDAESIRNDKRNCSAIAKDYGVSRKSISLIKQGKTWI